MVSPAEAQVAVLNGTSTPNLAHRLSASLQQSGYSQATPLNGTPPGSHQTTVIEYTSGHRAEAAQVAQALGVTQVQPIEAAVSPLVGSSTVVVIAGLDKAGAARRSVVVRRRAAKRRPAAAERFRDRSSMISPANARQRATIAVAGAASPR